MTQKLIGYLSIACIVFTASCSKSENSPVYTPPTTVNDTLPSSTAGNAILNLTDEQQVIDGFGGSTAWNGALSDAQADVLFGNSDNSQMGLTICRLRMDPNNNWDQEKSNAQKANARGAKVFASPWSPPVALKTNNNVVQGSVDPSKYADYALYLKSFGDYMKNAGVMLTAISIENEPDFKPDYESCSWTGAEIAKFAKENAPAVGYPLMIAESFGFNTSMTDPTLNDETACANVSYIGGHLYGREPFKYTNAIDKGKKIWMTEHYYDNANDNISIALSVAKEINACMNLNMNAYVWWWVLPLNGSVCNLINENKAMTKNGCALAQYSKWVRPGFKRVYITPEPYIGICMSAYKNGNKTVIVIVNSCVVAIKQPITIQNGTVTAFTPYETTATKNVAALSKIAVNNGVFSVNLKGQSITTLVSE